VRGVQVDALHFYADRLRELLSQIAAEKEACLPPNESAMPSAFVTFRERRDQARVAPRHALCQVIVGVATVPLNSFPYCSSK
jgi:hypothetical protein